MWQDKKCIDFTTDPAPGPECSEIKNKAACKGAKDDLKCQWTQIFVGQEKKNRCVDLSAEPCQSFSQQGGCSDALYSDTLESNRCMWQDKKCIDFTTEPAPGPECSEIKVGRCLDYPDQCKIVLNKCVDIDYVPPCTDFLKANKCRKQGHCLWLLGTCVDVAEG